jgi:protein tyrosine/serine phosphatase
MPGVGNLYRVSDTLYRSEQPTAEGMRELEKLGIRTVIDLRRDHDDTTETAGTRLHVIRIPTDAWDYGIKEEDVSAFLRAAVDPSNAPVLVHCQRGADRTGTMVAAYRIAVEGWDAGEAVAEMTEGPFRFNSLLFWLPRFVRGLDPEKLRAEAGLK